MANEIYEQTHKGLAEMVSARAATNVLQKALKANACNADQVDYAQMKACLQGFVYEELRNVLPSHGLKRQIKGILREISVIKAIQPEFVAVSSAIEEGVDEAIVEQAAKAVSEPQDFISRKTDIAAAKEIFAEASAATAEVVQVEDFDSVFAKTEVAKGESNNLDLIIEDIDLVRVGESQSTDKYADISDDMFEAVGQQHTIVDEEELIEAVVADSKPEIPKAIKKNIVRKKVKDSVDFSSVELSDLEELLQVFALVEGARAVAIVHSNGKLINSRGKGYDLDNLAILSNMALKLLKKSGDIRSYHLSVADSQLFLFPVGEYMIVVIGSEEINFGEIVSAFAAFEEEI